MLSYVLNNYQNIIDALHNNFKKYLTFAGFLSKIMGFIKDTKNILCVPIEFNHYRRRILFKKYI